MEVKLPTISKNKNGPAKKKLGRGESQQEKIRDGENQKMQTHEKVRKSRITLFFQCFVAPEGRKVGSKAAGAEISGQMPNEKLHPVVVRSRF